jgi:hypothetical protein
MDPWTWAHRRAGAAVFVVIREPYKHRDGTTFEFLLTITRRDGGRYDMRVASIGQLVELIEELVPDHVHTIGPDAEELLAAIEQRSGDETSAGTVH